MCCYLLAILNLYPLPPDYGLEYHLYPVYKKKCVALTPLPYHSVPTLLPFEQLHIQVFQAIIFITKVNYSSFITMGRPSYITVTTRGYVNPPSRPMPIRTFAPDSIFFKERS